MEVNLTLGKVLEIVDGTASSVDSDFIIKSIKSLESAKSQDLAVIVERGDASVFDAVSLDKIKNSKAGLILSSNADVTGKNYIIVKDAVGAFQKLVNYLNQQQATSRIGKNIDPTAVIDPSAVVCDGARIGAGSRIGALSFVGRNCDIGSCVTLHPGVKILDRCIIGDGTEIHSGAVVGSDGFGYKVTNQGMQKIPHIGIVRVGRMVEIGANTAIDRSSFDETVIGDGVKIDNLVHIAHNVKVGASTAILAHTSIGGSTQIGIGCQISGHVVVKNDVKIGNCVKIVSKSAVMNNLGDGEVVCGVPAIPFSKWKRISVLQLRLPEFAKFVAEIQRFIKDNNRSWFKRMIFKFFKKG